MITRSDLRKLGVNAAEKRAKSLESQIRYTKEEILRHARDGDTKHLVLVCEYSNDKEYCDSFLAGVKAMFPDVHVKEQNYPGETTYYTFSWAPEDSEEE